MNLTIEQIRSSEDLVREKLLHRGFVVSGVGEPETRNGIDIVAIKDNQAFLIEVKSVCVSQRSMSVTPVSDQGKLCDYIAIVTPKLNIIFQPMSDHLALCSESGSRGVTKLVRAYDL